MNASLRRQGRLVALALVTTFALAALTTTSAHAGRRVVMCTLNWQPFYAADLPRKGFFSALVRAAFDRSGHETELQFMPWARAMLEVKHGDRDVAMGAYYNKKRAKAYLMSDPVYSTDVGLIALKKTGITKFDSLRDLTDYTIGVGRGFSVNEEFDNADYLDKEVTTSFSNSISKLFAGRIDMIAGGIDNIRYLAKQAGHDLDKLVVLTPVLKTNDLVIMVSRDIPDGDKILADFNSGLKKIRKDGTYDQILTDMGYK